MQRVVVAMSGGVDSSVTALLLQRAGYEVIGLTMKVWEDGSRCCGLEDVRDAQHVAMQLGIRHYIVNLKSEFEKQIVDYFVNEYIAGRTPNPCVMCNQRIKFGALLSKALSLSADLFATGHYVNKYYRNGRYVLAQAKDKSKSQEYFLALLNQQSLKYSIFPIGGYTKEEIRNIATENQLKVAWKRESQEICFIAHGDYTELIEKKAKTRLEAGNILDTQGKIIGRHRGVWRYTIGQRHGLGLAMGKPQYVIQIIPERNAIVVGDISELYKKEFSVRALNWMKIKELKSVTDALVKIRYLHNPVKATLFPEPDSVTVRFTRAQRAITPGQLAVFYDGEEVIGSGWINR